MVDNDTWCVVVAGGSGARFGAPKQFVELGGVALLDRSVAVARQVCVGVVVVVPSGAPWDPPPGVVVTTGGPTRSASVRAGLAVVPLTVRVVVVHDATRPLASPGLFARVVAAVTGGAAGAIPVLPVVDTVKYLKGDEVGDTVDRETLVMVQTPQAFAAGVLREAHAGGHDETDDAALVVRVGRRVIAVPGEVRNIKITVPDDLGLAAALLQP